MANFTYIDLRIHRGSLLIKQPGMAHGMTRFYPQGE